MTEMSFNGGANVASTDPRVVHGMTCKQAAHWYLDQGLRPIPWVVGENGQKQAAIAGFTYRDYTVTHSDIERWPDHWQVGLAMGQGHWAVDVDSYAELHAWEQQHAPAVGLERRGWRQTSGRADGGEHRLYRSVPGEPEPEHGKFGPDFPHLEIISNGLLAVAPSVHPSGRQYRWADGGMELDEPGGLLRAYVRNRAYARAHARDRASAGAQNGGGSDPGTTDALDVEALLLHGIQPHHGGHDNTLTRLAFQLKLQGRSRTEAQLMWRMVVLRTDTDPARPFTDQDFERHWNSAEAKLAAYMPPVVEEWMYESIYQWARDSAAGLSYTDDAQREPSAEERADPEIGRMVEQGLKRHKAQQIIRREIDGETFTQPEIKDGAAFLAEPDEDVHYRVDQLWPAGGRVLLAAQYKAGKTTMRDNLVRSLVDGDPFLDEFAVQPVTGRVVVLDLELSQGMMRRWLRDQRIQNPNRVAVSSLRGNTSALDLFDDEVMDWWARRLRELECEVLILDCLRPILDALGLSEDKDAGRFLTKFDELLTRAGVTDAVVIHHMGHTGDRSRGDSRLRDWPDAEWILARIVQDNPRSPRHFQALGRDVDVPARRIDFNEASRRLTAGMAADLQTERAMAEDETHEDIVNAIVDIVADAPEGIGTNQLQQRIGGNSGTFRQARDAAVQRGLITERRHGQRRTYFPIEIE